MLVVWKSTGVNQKSHTFFAFGSIFMIQQINLLILGFVGKINGTLN